MGPASLLYTTTRLPVRSVVWDCDSESTARLICPNAAASTATPGPQLTPPSGGLRQVSRPSFDPLETSDTGCRHFGTRWRRVDTKPRGVGRLADCGPRNGSGELDLLSSGNR